MKDIFKGYYHPTEDEFKKLWNEGIFVLDSSAILDLYRIPKESRKDFLKALSKLSNRLWVPYQVALEYQRNRHKVISNQVKQHKIKREEMNKVIDELNKKPKRFQNTDFIKKVEEEFESFQRKLDCLEEEQLKSSDYDGLRTKIDSLITGKIGKKPENQEWLDDIYEKGEVRYKKKQPPGYEDEGKQGEFTYDNLFYKEKYGDLILWNQIIMKSKDQKIRYLAFIGSEKKEDWLWKEKDDKIIGPHPELSREISSEAGVLVFHIYSPERFVKYAKDHFNIDITQESIDHIRDASDMHRLQISDTIDLADKTMISNIPPVESIPSTVVATAATPIRSSNATYTYQFLDLNNNGKLDPGEPYWILKPPDQDISKESK